MKTKNRIREQLISYIRKLIFKLILEKVKIDARIEILAKNIRKHVFTIWTFLYFLILFIAIYGIGFYLPPNLTKDFVGNLYLGEAAVIGTVLTIGFSFSIFLIQHAAQNLPSGFYKMITRYVLHDVIFFLSAFLILSLFSFALLNGSLGWGLSSQAIQLSLFMVGVSLYLMFYLYYKVGQKVDPFNVLRDIKTRQLNYLDQVRKRAEKFARILNLNPVPKEKVSKETAIAFVFGQMPQPLSHVNDEVQYMFDYHDKVLSNQEKQLALYALSEIGIVLQKYFEIRKDSSLLLPYGLLGRTSDSQSFLTPSLERFMSTGKNYIRIFNNEGITQIVNVLTNLSLSASNIKFTPPLSGENPIVGQCRGYLDMLMDVAITYKYEEALFQAANAYRNIGLMTVDKELPLERSSVFTILYKIGYSSITSQQQIVFEYVIRAYVEILSKLIESKYFNLEMEIDNLFEHVDNLILANFLTIKAFDSIQNRRFSQEVLALPYKIMESVLFALAKQSKRLSGDELRKNNNMFTVVAEQLRSSLRTLSEKMRSADHLLIDNLARINGDVGSLIIELTSDKKWIPEKQELVRIAGWYVHQPYWFTHEVKEIDNNLSFRALPESVAQMGINALKQNLDELATDAVKDIHLFATLMIEKEKRTSYGFTEPRIMELACHIGIIALKLGKSDIVKFVKEKIKDFEKQYKKLWFPKDEDDTRSSIKKDQLMIEIIKLIDQISDTSRRGLPPIFPEDNLVRSMINQQDVEKFIYEIWRVKIKQ